MVGHAYGVARLLHGLAGFGVALAVLSAPAYGQNATAISSGVSPSGAFNFSIPIRVPPGTAGVQPALSLTYNSQSGSGVAGVGWNLSGASVITRCPRTIAVDGVKGGVNIDSNDRLCLDGQRLLYQAGGSGYGTGGAIYFTEIFNGSKIVQLGGTAQIMMIRPGQINRGGGGAIIYAAAPPAGDVEPVAVPPATSGGAEGSQPTIGKPTVTSNASALAVGTVNPDSATVRFRVFTKAGEVMEYVDAPYNTVSGTNGIRMWLLSKVIDVKGNYFDLSYGYDDNIGEYNLTRIRYTGNAAKGLLPYNEVRFTYEVRPDTTTAYLGGAKLSSTKRLTSISTWYTPSSGGALTRVTQYQLNYDLSPVTKRSRLRSVQEQAFDSAGNSASLNPISFNYSEDAAGASDWGTNWSSGAMDWGFSAGRAWVDMIGGGRAGFCRQVGSPGNYRLVCNQSRGSDLYGYYVSQPLPINPSYGGYYADVNGDGILDFCNVTANNGGGPVYCHLGPISGSMTTLTTPYIDIGWPDGRAFVDVNGDGRADYCRITGSNVNDGGAFLYCRMSDGGTFGAEVGSGQAIDPGFGSAHPADLQARYWADVNGDGLPDFCRGVGSWNPNYYIRCSLAPNFNPANDWTVNVDHGYGPGRQFVDINGDGKADLCRIVGSNPYYLKCAISTGTTFVDTYIGGVLNDPGYAEGRAWADVNGDGLPDFCRLTNGSAPYNVTCRVSPAYTTDVVVATVWDAGYTDTRDFADTAGDGRARFCRLVGGGNWSNDAICTGRPLASADVMTSFTSGLGLVTTVQSAPLPSLTGDRYQRASLKSYPQQNVTPPMFVVRDLVTGVPGGTVTTSYGYINPVNDALGRGFAGFESVYSWNDKTQMRSQTWSNLAWPYAGSPSTQLVMQPNNAGSVSSSSVSYQGMRLDPLAGTWVAGCVAGQVCTVGPSTSISRSWDLNRTPLPQTKTTTQIDGWGNPKSVIVETLNGTLESFNGPTPTGTSPEGTPTGYRKTTTSDYLNDPAKWWIGRLLKSTVTSEKPAE
jgi:hypothetical protein